MSGHPISTETINNRFEVHYATDAARLLHKTIHSRMLETAHRMNEDLPVCREKSLAMTKLEEAMFWANAAIARNHDKL